MLFRSLPHKGGPSFVRKILLVIDMQNDFINGALGTPEAEAIVDRVAEEIGKYPAGDVIATRDTHPENYLETQEGRNLPVVHCVKGTTGWELHPKIAAALKDAVVIDKPTFGSKELAEKLTRTVVSGRNALTSRALETTQMSVQRPTSVISNALLVKAFLPETTVRVIADCCAGVTPESHKAALDTMRMCQIQIQ